MLLFVGFFGTMHSQTALHIAASEGHLELCQFLIQSGAQINRSDRWGGSPLNDALRHRHAPVIDYLKQVGGRSGSPSQSTCFITAAAEGDLEEVQHLLEFGNVSVNQGDYDKRTCVKDDMTAFDSEMESKEKAILTRSFLSL